MLITYLKVTIEKKERTQNFDKKTYKARLKVSFGSPHFTQISLNFPIFLLQLKNQRPETKIVCGFSIIFILKAIITFKVKQSMFFAEQKYEFIKNETE